MRWIPAILILISAARSGSADDEQKEKIQKRMKRVISLMSGNWQAVDTYQKVEGGSFETTCKVTTDLDGLILRFEYATDMKGMKYQAVGILTYNPETKNYALAWYTNLGDHTIFAGDSPGRARLVLTAPKEDEGPHLELTWQFVDTDHFRLVLEDRNAANGKGDWIFRSLYTREGAQPNAAYECRPCKLYKELPDGGERLPACPECGKAMQQTRFSW